MQFILTYQFDGGAQETWGPYPSKEAAEADIENTVPDDAVGYTIVQVPDEIVPDDDWRLN